MQMQNQFVPTLVKPSSLLCYLCGKEYGSSSLKFHLKTCTQLWQNENPKKSLPDPPDLYEWVAVSGKASKAEKTAYNSQAYYIFCNLNLGACMYCGHYFHPQAMDLHVADCYRVFRSNQEAARKNAEHQVKSNKSQQEAVKFAERKRNFEEGLAKDIMNQFMAEVTKEQNKKAPQKEHPRGAWGKKMGSLPVLSEENESGKFNTREKLSDDKVIEKDVQANVQGKWKQRLQKSTTLEVKPIHPKVGQQDALEERPIGSIENIFANDEPPEYPLRNQAQPKQAKASPQKPMSLQEARLNKWNSNQGEKSKPQGKNLDKVMNNALAIGGNHKEMLRNAVKEMDPDTKEKAEVFFFEKIGAALLNNFKINLQQCRHCARKFDPRRISVTEML